MTRINKHQIFFISLSLVILYMCLTSQPRPLADINISISGIGGTIIFFSLCLIGTLGVGHGALDGKVIWEHSDKVGAKIKLYALYILLVSLGAILWFSSPFCGLVLLLLLSSIHFGLSDLDFLGNKGLIPKICWGFTMTFLPVLFKPSLVYLLFFELTSVSISTEIFDAIRILLILSIFIFISCLISRILKKEKKDSIALKLAILELSLLIILTYYLSPLIWFTLYFCGLHGLRTILAFDFKFIPDVLWLIIFTAPISLFIFLVEWGYDLGSLLIVFPVLASLTIAHMLLPRLKDLVES
ncbi:MAG: Brp/Blh family beta-carotene 15,15'-monooxygenase [Porticoccus sp.]|jgi:Brp/Blh family beta-carotene 15,15'-monooxygenase